MATTTNGRITPKDLEDRFRALQASTTERVVSARTRMIQAGAAAAVLLLVAAYLLGRRKGKRKSTIVEIRRL